MRVALKRAINAMYDYAGNQITYNGHTFEYDADGRNTVVKLGGSTVTTNVFDGMGRRVKKVENGVTVYYVYDAFGRLAAEYLPASGILGFIGHGIVELGGGSLFFRNSTALDPRY